MSKSLGNVVDPNEIIKKYGIDSVRLYFISKGPLFKDMDFEENDLLMTHNRFLIDAYMNMLFRIMGKKVMKKLKNIIKRPVVYDQAIISKVNQQVDLAAEFYSSYDFAGAFKCIEEIVFLGNHFLSAQ